MSEQEITNRENVQELESVSGEQINLLPEDEAAQERGIDAVTLDLRVSSGTYVRAIAQALGGHCRTLRRTAVGPFSVEDAVTPELFEPGRLLDEAEVLAAL